MTLLEQAQAIAAKQVVELEDLNLLNAFIDRTRGIEADRIGDLIEAAMLNASEGVLERYFEQGVDD